jgi:hypothetical protein
MLYHTDGSASPPLELKSLFQQFLSEVRGDGK